MIKNCSFRKANIIYSVFVDNEMNNNDFSGANFDGVDINSLR